MVDPHEDQRRRIRPGHSRDRSTPVGLVQGRQRLNQTVGPTSSGLFAFKLRRARDNDTFRSTWRLHEPTGHQVTANSVFVTYSLPFSDPLEIMRDGKLTRTDRPPSGTGSAVTEAPCAEAMARTMERPSPWPSL